MRFLVRWGLGSYSLWGISSLPWLCDRKQSPTGRSALPLPWTLGKSSFSASPCKKHPSLWPPLEGKKWWKIKKFADILFCSPVKFLKTFFLLLFFLRCQISKENFSKPGKLFLELPKENFQLINKEEIRTKSHKIYCKYTLIKEVQN